MTSNTFILLYTSLVKVVIPHLDYASSVWCPYKIGDIEDIELECGPMPNVMAALPNTSGALCSTPRRKLWRTPTAGVPCSNAAKTRNPLKLDGVPQTTGPNSAASGPMFTILWGTSEGDTAA